MSSLFISNIINRGKKAPLEVLQERQLELQQLISDYEEKRKEVLSWDTASYHNKYDASRMTYYIDELKQTITKEKTKIDFLTFGMELREKKGKSKIGKKFKIGYVFTEPILQRVNQLPEDTVSIIRDFLPIDVHNRLLSFNLLTKLNKITDKNEDLRNLYRHIISSPQSLALISDSEAITRIKYINGGYYNHKYSAEYFSQSFNYKAGEIKTAIAFYIHKAMEITPLFAHILLKTVALLEAKKIKSKYHYIFHALTEQDAAAANIARRL